MSSALLRDWTGRRRALDALLDWRWQAYGKKERGLSLSASHLPFAARTGDAGMGPPSLQ